MTRKIGVITGTRAEYGLLRGLIRRIQDDPGCELQLFVTGMHLSNEFGATYREIVADGFPITQKVEMLLGSDTPSAVTKSIGLGTIGFADAFQAHRPDLVVVLGDRFEILAAVSAALVARIPVAHIHGGEATEGAFDESIRHSLTKMSHLHFVAADEYRRRVIQLGEQPERVFLVGGLGVDGLTDMKLLDRAALETAIGLRLKARNYLVTFHPVTLEHATSQRQMGELLDALSELRDTGIVFTYPNADTEGRVLIGMIERFVADRPESAVAHASLGQQRYLSCLAQVDAVIGNSSSGLTEAPSFKVATINIGDRQRGRLRAASVVDAAPTKAGVLEAIAAVQEPAFVQALKDVRNPYGDGGASAKIFDVIKSVPLADILKKRFFDL